MKPRLFYTVFLLLPAVCLFAADSTFNWPAWRKTWAIEKLDTKAILPQTDSNLVKTIEVVDMRSDTTCVGLYTSRSHRPHALLMDVSLNELLNDKLAKNASGQTLLIVVRSLWVNETKLYNEEIRKPRYGGSSLSTFDGRSVTTNRSEPILLAATKIKFTADVFILSNGIYFPLIRFDTLLTHHKKAGKAAEMLVEDVFYYLNKKIARSMDSNRYQNRKAASRESIYENYNKDFHFPALTDAVIKKGVFYSWQQFKNNQPEETAFRIQLNEKEPPTLYVKDEQGKEILSRKVYALNDGIRTYKVHKGYVFEMYRDHRSIYWMGVEELDAKTRSVPLLVPLPGAVGVGSEAYGSRVKVRLTPFLLNMETGEEY